MGWISYIVIICILVAFNLFSFDSIMRMRKDIAAIRRALVPASASKRKVASNVSTPSTATTRKPESIGSSVSSILSRVVDNVAGKV